MAETEAGLRLIGRRSQRFLTEELRALARVALFPWKTECEVVYRAPATLFAVTARIVRR